MITALYIKTTNALYDFKNDQRGVTAIEYAIIGVAMSAIVLAVFNTSLKDALTAAMTTITTNIGAAGK
ncbi:Flp family type IVb pilin [Moritella sp. F3]|uniref:Flp family type IVb pilin n=1 Tax=Moritella sp. F3 TaxID=2718882 RepID=UPI0018E16711|nr:Flp family type IVb pilin [Moritella sp. F3]GIC78883.1 fimbrial protein [Moritella sp. F1]GIC81882.1 fimbrial protein [Moritella sp. F3]